MKNFLLIISIITALVIGTGCAKKQTVAQEKETPKAVEVNEGQNRGVEAPPAETKAAEAPKAMASGPSAAEMEAILVDIHFDFDKSDLKAESKDTLQKIADFLSKNSNIIITVEGNCDERGTSEYNLALGDSRAKSAQSFLSSQGIKGDRVKTVSYGKEKPVCSEHNEACWSKNRRDHFVPMGAN